MALTINQLIVVYSGGASIDSPLTAGANLGGVISTATNKRIKSQTASSLTNVTGVSIIDAYGNPEGVGSLSYTASGTTLGWKPYGQTTYYGTNVGVSGTYLIGSSSGYLVVTVTAGSLAASDKLDSVTISNNQHNIFPLVSESDSLLGKTEYRGMYIQNSSGTDTATDVRLWIYSNTPGGDNISIALAAEGTNVTMATIANGTTAPSGVTFSQPATYSVALQLGNLAPGAYRGFWQRRIVPAETRGTVISNGAVLAIAATI